MAPLLESEEKIAAGSKPELTVGPSPVPGSTHQERELSTSGFSVRADELSNLIDLARAEYAAAEANGFRL